MDRVKFLNRHWDSVFTRAVARSVARRRGLTTMTAPPAKFTSSARGAFQAEEEDNDDMLDDMSAEEPFHTPRSESRRRHSTTSSPQHRHSVRVSAPWMAQLAPHPLAKRLRRLPRPVPNRLAKQPLRRTKVQNAHLRILSLNLKLYPPPSVLKSQTRDSLGYPVHALHRTPAHRRETRNSRRVNRVPVGS